jgi:hypothetical protein
VDTRAQIVELLRWVAERPRMYDETIDAWGSHCPRLTVWEDAIDERLLRVERGRVVLTNSGRELVPTVN